MDRDNWGHKRKRLMRIDDSSSSGSTDSPPLSRRRRRLYNIQESNSDTDSSGSSIEINPRRRVARVRSDSSESSESEIPRTDVDEESSSGSSDSESYVQPVNAVSIVEDSSTDSGDADCEKCPICLMKFKNQEVGAPDNCSHSFCATCIEEWSKSVNTCPVDRIKFSKILVRNNYTGDKVRTIPVTEPSNASLLISVGEVPDTLCEICGSGEREDRLLLCDGCDLAYHLECLNPPLGAVPEGQWFCEICRSIIGVDESFGNQRLVVELEDMLEFANDFDLSHVMPRSRSRNNRRLVPRTLQSERIRTRIVFQRRLNLVNDTSREDSIDNVQPGPSSSRPRQPTKRKTTKKRKCKKSRRRPKYKITYEIDEDTGKKIAIKKATRKYRKKRKYRKRKIKKVVVTKSVKKRLAKHLGMRPPKLPGQTLPDIKVKLSASKMQSRRAQANLPALHLFGQRNELNYFSGSDSEIEGSSGVNIVVGRRPNISDISVMRRAARNKANILSRPIETTSTADVLGSILNIQTKFHAKNSVISMKDDGSLKIDVNKNNLLPKNNRRVNLQDPNVRVYQTPMLPNNSNSEEGTYTAAETTSSNNETRATESNSLPTSTVECSDLPTSNNFPSNNDDNDAQDYSMNRNFDDHQVQNSKPKKKNEDDESADPTNEKLVNSDSELDIYGDIEAVTTSKVEDVEETKSPEPLQLSSNLTNTCDDNDSDTDLVIDTEKADADKYDPATVFESDDEKSKEDETVTSTSEPSDTSKRNESSDTSKRSESIPAVWNVEIQSKTVQSTNQNEFYQSATFPEEEDKPEDDEPEDDCPNSNIYSSESLDLAKNSELSLMMAQRIFDSKPDDDDPTSDDVPTSAECPASAEIPTSPEIPSLAETPTSDEIPKLEETQDEIKLKEPKSSPVKKICTGLYSDSEDEGMIKFNSEAPFGIADIRNMTEDISEDERSYTPCLDEKEPTFGEGLEGLETEMISDDEKNDFEEAQEQEMKTVSDGDALEINAKESELDFTRPEDCEEGEIVDKLKSKQEEPPKEDVPETVTPIVPPPVEKEPEPKEPIFKKIRSNKDRHYRDKENKEKEKSKSKERKVKNRQKRERQRKERRGEIMRYNVRSLVETRPKKDEFGRDNTRRRSPSTSRSGSPQRRLRKSGSFSSKSPSPRRFGRENRKRTPSSSKSKSPVRRSLSRGRKSISPDRRKRRGKSMSRSKSRGRKRSRSRPRKRNQSWSRERMKPRKKSVDKVRRKKKHGRSTSRSPSPRRRDWGRRNSRGWTPSLSRSRSPDPKRFTPSWTPPRSMAQNVRPQNLTVILPNDSNKKKKDKRKKQEKKKDAAEKPKKRRRSERSPLPSKEVFASGNNILVSVSFNKDNEGRPEKSKRKRDTTLTEELTTKRTRKEIQSKNARTSKRVKNSTNIKPVAIIDLDRSPFKELTPSPKDIIVLSDSDNADSNDLMGLQNSHRGQSPQQAASPETVANNNYINTMGPKTPPEPQVKFTFTNKQTQLRSITNPLHEPDDPEDELDPQAELEDRLNEVAHKGPNTPPEPPNSPPSSPDAYDPFDPTKSRSPTPEPKQSNAQSSVTQTIEDSQEELIERSETEKSGLSTSQTSKSHTPPNPTADIQPADSQSSVRAMTPDTNQGSSPERTIAVVINQVVQSQPSAVFPNVPKSVAPLTYSSGSTSLITSTPISSSLSLPRINILNSTVLTPPVVTSSVSQRIVLPNTTKSSPVNQKTISPTKPAIKLTPIKPMPSKNAKQSANAKSAYSKASKARNNENDSANLDFESPYSPGSSDYEDLFEPPPESSKSTNVVKPAPANKSAAGGGGGKNQNSFDTLFGSSPVYNKKQHKTKAAKPAKKAHHGSKGTKQVGVKLDEDNLKILDELPNSAVEMQVKDKFLKKLNRQERVVEEVKFVLKPYYNKKRISKDEYKDILRRAVPKICHNKSGEINPKKIQQLVEAYVKKLKHNKKVTSSSSVNPQKTEVVSNWLSKLN